MKKILLFLVAMFSIVALMSAQTKSDLKYWGPVIQAIAKIESGNNPKAVSKSGKYCGLLQIAHCVVDDVNEYLGKKKYTYNDRFNAQKSKEMFVLIQERYNKTKSIEKACRLWQGGCGGFKSVQARNYYRKVSKDLSLICYN